MSAGFVTVILLCSAVLLSVSMTTVKGRRHHHRGRHHSQGQGARGLVLQKPAARADPQRGDPCATSSNQSLTCCIGSRKSTLIHVDEECCNGSPVEAGQMCCDEALPVTKSSQSHDACCLHTDYQGGETYDSETHYCDTGTGEILEIPSGDESHLGNFWPPGAESLEGSEEGWQQDDGRGAESVCGSASYSPRRYICCMGHVVKKPAEDSICCYDQAYSSEDPSNPCLGHCGDTEYNSETHLCCQQSAIPSTSNSDICCGREVINSETHVCCRGRPYAREENSTNDSCDFLNGDVCGRVKFNRGEQLCCQNAVVPVSSPSDICCGKKAMSSETHECCGGVSLPTSSFSCCLGSLPYVRRYVKCRRDGRLSRRVRGLFKAGRVCGRLPTWSSEWPELRLQTGRQLIYLKGKITNVTKTPDGNLHLTLNLETPSKPNSLLSQSEALPQIVP